MLKIILTLALCLSFSSQAEAQKLVTGSKAPELRISRWMNGEPDRRNKAVLLEFYHSSDAQCTARLPRLQSIAAQYRSNLCVVVLSREAADKVEPLLLPASRDYYAALDDDGRTFAGYGIQYVPFSVFIDSKGRVAWFGNPASLDDHTIWELLK